MKQISKYLNYYITKNGDVYRNDKRMSPSISNQGYYRISLSNNNIKKTYSVHGLVAEAFIPNPNNYPFINHKDGNKLNNNDWNLEWCTNSQNLKHAYKLGLKSAIGVNNGRSKLTNEQVLQIKILISKNIKLLNISKLYNISYTVISEIKRGIKWKHLHIG